MDSDRPGGLKPDYEGGGIVNLMASVIEGLGGEPNGYPPLEALPPGRLAGGNVVLLVVDGLGYELLTAHAGDGALARRLESRITSVFPTTTASAITTFLTGTAPQQHGVTGWFTWFREIGGVLAVLPYRPRHGGAAPSVSATELFGHVPVFDRLDPRSYVIVPEHIAHSDYNTAHNGSARVLPYTSLAQMLGAVEQAVTMHGERSYVYAYWPELDRLAHEHGSESRQALGHLARFDEAFGGFLERIAGSDTTVIVTADHGFIDAAPERGVSLDAHPQLERMLALPLCGERRSAYCYLRDGRRGAFEDYVGEHLSEHAELRDSASLIESGYFGSGAPHPRLHERVGDCALLMKDGAIIKDWLAGESRHTQVGVHGGLSSRELYVPLIVAEC